MTLPLVSIIIPIYNVDPSAFKLCMDSVQKQLYRNLEVILVDDGSVESVAHYIDQITSGDKRIYVYHRQHKGVSAARNWGIRQAHGDYITFVDADDSISPDMISSSVDCAIAYETDIVLWDHMKVTGNIENHFSPQSHPQITIFQGSQITSLQQGIWDAKPNKECTALKSLPLSVCKLYTSQLLRQNSLFFHDSLSIGEDTLFALEALEHAHKLIALDKVMYFHKIHDTSLSHGYHPDALIKWSKNRKVFYNYLSEGRLSAKLYKSYDMQAIFAVKTLLINTFAHPQCKLKRKELKETLEADAFALSLNSLRWKDVNSDSGAWMILILYRLKLYGSMILLGKIRRKQLKQ